MDITSRIQFGVDFATSLAIFGAAISWLLNERRKQRRGISQETRGIALKRLQDTLSDLSKIFLDMIHNQSKITRNLKHTPLRLAGLLAKNPAMADKMTSALKGFQDDLSLYYEAIHRHKYLLYPVLDSLSDSEGQKILVQLKSDFEEIGGHYNSVSAGWSALLDEFGDILILKSLLVDDSLALSEEEAIGKLVSDKEVRSRVTSILFDQDYWQWVQSFVPSDREEDYLQEYEATEVLDRELVTETMLNFTASLVQKPDELHAQILLLLADNLQDAGTSCKKILCSLSGISAFLLARETQSTEQLSSVIERMKSQDYFNLEQEIR